MKQINQRDAIKSHLLSGGTITGLEALDKFGCFRLPSRIHELKREGMNIRSELVTIGDKNIAKYSLA